MLSAAILLFTALYCIFIYIKPKRPKNFPPGPNAYPIIGSGLELAKLGDSACDSFKKLGEIYGDISAVFLGNYPTIIINGHEATKQFYSVGEFSARPELFLINHRWGGRQLGVFFSNGRLWQEQRKFTIRHLRDLGLAKTNFMERLIHEESEECIKSMKRTLKEAGESGVINISDRFGVSMINILWAIVAGTRYSHEDMELKKLLKIIQSSFRSGSNSSPLIGILNTFPWSRHLPYIKQQFKAINSGTDAVIDLISKTIDDHERTYNPRAQPRDLIDAYLKAIEDAKGPDTTFFKDQLVQVCADLFTAGSELTANSVAFLVLHLIRNPECQEKVHQELDAVLGRERLASFEDKEKFPYTCAVITESYRISPVAPMSAIHSCSNDVNLMGYDIPKDTWALVNYISANMDRTYWGDPENFRPERFLDSNGQFDKAKLDHVHGFGAGKRQCFGEPLARISNFLLFTATMQHFKFEIPPGHSKPTAEPSEGFTVAPKPFSAKVTVRY